MTQTRVKGDNWSSVETADLRLYQTRITWLRSLSAILPLFWRHDMANFLTFPAKTLRSAIMTSWDTRRFPAKLG